MTESHVFNSPDSSKFNEPTSIVDETPMDKKLPCRFSPIRSLEQIIDELKGKVTSVPMNESNPNNNDKPVIKRICKGKRVGNIIIKNTTSFKSIINSELSDPSLANF